MIEVTESTICLGCQYQEPGYGNDRQTERRYELQYCIYTIFEVWERRGMPQPNSNCPRVYGQDSRIITR